MTDDLVQRLRRTYRKEYAPTRSMCGDNSNKPFPFPILATEVPVNPDGHEAADRIEALTAEVARLRDIATDLASSLVAAERNLFISENSLSHANKENERLRTALERIGVATRNEARAGDKGYVSRYGINGIVSAALEKQP